MSLPWGCRAVSSAGCHVGGTQPKWFGFRVRPPLARLWSCGLIGPLVWDLEGGAGLAEEGEGLRSQPRGGTAPQPCPSRSGKAPSPSQPLTKGRSSSFLALGDPCCGALDQHVGGGVGGGDVCSRSGWLVRHKWARRWGSGDRASRVSHPSQSANAVRKEDAGLCVCLSLV